MMPPAALESVVGVAHVFATLFMTGLIWFVQVVHYPLFSRVAESGFCAYEKAHQARTTIVVGPMMLLEALTAVWLVFLVDADDVPKRTITLVGVGLLVVIWLSTALVQGPAHQRLAAGFDAKLWRLLVRSNWVRTAAWSGRGVLALLLLSIGS
jgi:hypothetical protein